MAQWQRTGLGIQRLVVQIPPAAPIFIYATRQFQRKIHIDLWECVCEDSQTPKISGKFTSIYGNLHVKIPKHTKYGKIFHHTMRIYVGKFLAIQNICESLVWYMENAQRKIKLYARMKLLLNIDTREIDCAFATVYIRCHCMACTITYCGSWFNNVAKLRGYPASVY